MKKIVLLIWTFLVYTSLNGLSLGNPLDPGMLCNGWFTGNGNKGCCYPCDWSALSFRGGFYGDYVFNRHMRVHEKGNDAIIDTTRIFTNAGYLALNVWNRLDIFATLGASEFDLSTSERAFFIFDNPEGTFEIETSTSFSWSVGARATLIEYCGTILGIEGQYFQTKPSVKKAIVEGFLGAYVSEFTNYFE